MMRCVIIDDEPLAVDVLENYVNKTPFLTLAASFTDPLEALDYLNNENVDLLFLDIQMPEITGLQFLKILKSNLHVILTTAYRDYALEGYEYNVTDYLLKPISFDRFLKAVQKVGNRPLLDSTIREEPMLSLSGYIFIKTDTRIVKIMLDDILYIEGKKDYISIVTKKEKTFTLQNMKKMEEFLPYNLFIRVHKSYIIAISKIKSIEHNTIFIEDAVIPIGETYKDTFQNCIKERKLF